MTCNEDARLPRVPVLFFALKIVRNYPASKVSIAATSDLTAETL